MAAAIKGKVICNLEVVMRRLLIVPILWAALLHSGDVGSQEIITWAKTDFPPVSILTGKDANKGYGDQTREYFTDRLTEFSHRHLEMSIGRIETMMQTRDGFCDATLFKTADRQRFMEFSDQVYWIQANRIVFLTENAERFQKHILADGSISLETLAADDDMSGAVVRGRSYSPSIDVAIADMQEKPNLVEVTETDQKFLMLAKGRVDWIAGYSFEASYVFRKMGLGNVFLSFGADGDSAFIPGYFACSKGPLGKRVISRINSLIAESGTPPSYVRYYQDWLDSQAFMDMQKAMLVLE